MSAHRKEITRGIVLARYSAGEGSSRVLFYTEALGLVTALAKSAREERSKLRPHLQPGTQGTFSFVEGRDTWRVTGATATMNVYFELGERAAAKEAAARILSALRQFVHGEGKDQFLFDTLSNFVSSLPTIADDAVPVAECIALLRILFALGYVREDEKTKEFLTVSYDAETLARAQGARALLVRTVNEAIAASGL